MRLYYNKIVLNTNKLNKTNNAELGILQGFLCKSEKNCKNLDILHEDTDWGFFAGIWCGEINENCKKRQVH